MAATLQLGLTPGKLVVKLSPGSVFAASASWKRRDGTPYVWPSNSTVKLVFTGAHGVIDTWVAEVEGSITTFRATVTEVERIPDLCGVQLFADTSGDGSAPQLLLTGRAVTHD